MIIIHEKSGLRLAANVKIANGFQKLRGLMFAEGFGFYDGIYFSWRNSVHNCFVKFPIDVVFISKDSIIVRIVRNLQPWQFTSIYFKARHTIEFPSGAVPESVREGDRLVLEF